MSINISRLRKHDNGKEDPVNHLLDFVELPCSHTGLNMAKCVERVLKEYGIQDKVSLALYTEQRTDTYLPRS